MSKTEDDLTVAWEICDSWVRAHNAAQDMRQHAEEQRAVLVQLLRDTHEAIGDIHPPTPGGCSGCAYCEIQFAMERHFDGWSDTEMWR